MSEAAQSYSQHPFLRDLQNLQLAVEMADDTIEKAAIAKTGLGLLNPVPAFLGRYISALAVPIYGRTRVEDDDFGLEYQDEILFAGKAIGVGFSNAKSKILVAIREPKELHNELELEIPLAAERAVANVPDVEEVYVGVLDFIKFGVELRAIQEVSINQC